ncbi:MAG: ankyrin repeat domain-containing protein, partial [bacterium]
MLLSNLHPARLALLILAVMCPVSAHAAADAQVADAVQRNDAAAVAALLAAGADVNAPQPDGATALHWAVHREAVDLAGRLVAAGARVDTANDLGVSALAIACRNGSVSMVDLLLDRGATVTAAEPSG